MWWLILAFVLLILLYAWFLEPAWLEVSSEQVAVDATKLKSPVRILFISDLHGGFLVSNWICRWHITTMTRQQAYHPYDAVLLGGDYVDVNPRFLNQAEEVIREFISWKVPVYAVPGNHDYKAYKGDISELRRRFEALGVVFLVNESAVFSVGRQQIEVVGMDDLQHDSGYWVKGQKKALIDYHDHTHRMGWYRKFDENHPELPRILLVHNPDGVYLSGRHPDLVLAGHTHGGQYAPWAWLTPFMPKFLNPKGSFSVWAGRRLVEGRNLIVSRGIGGSFLPARFFCRPQVLDINLVPAIYPKHIVVGISGKPRSGKDTVAAMVEALLPGITRSDFSRIMRKEYDAEHGTNILHDEHEKERLRAHLTEFVNEKRGIDPDYWIKQVFAQHSPLLVTPIRFEREIAATKAAGGVVVLVRAGHQHLRKRIRADFHAQMKMPNESLLDRYDDWDYVIENDSSLLDLEHKVRGILLEILEQAN